MNEPYRTQFEVRCAFNGFCKKALKYEASNAHRDVRNRQIREVTFSDLTPEEESQLYKNAFGQFSDVSVYGTSPKKTALLKINPFSFPEDVHILEHLDRVVEIFNVCWPMYAAMPAILKEAIEKAYVSTGWDLTLSENSKGRKFPNSADILEQIETVINESKYSADSKGDYSGALLRVVIENS